VATYWDDALAAIDDVDGHSLDLQHREPVTPDFPVAEYRRRYARLQMLMDRRGLDALVLTQEQPIRYLSGYNSVIWLVSRWLPTVFVATRDPKDALLLTSAFDAGCAEGTSWVSGAATYQSASEIPARVSKHLRDLGLSGVRVGCELGQGTQVSLPYSMMTELITGVGGAPQDASRLLSVLRMLKSEAEVVKIRRSVASAVAGYRAGLAAATAGMTEKELVSIIGSTMHATGTTAGTRPFFVNCVAGRRRYPLVDTPASDNAFADGDVVFVDGGGGSDGYVSDILRLIGIGPLRPEDRRYAEVAALATESMVDTCRPGARVSELHQAGAGRVAAEGVTDSIGVVAGHGIGLDLWEAPFVSPHADAEQDVTIRAGMVLCLEPILAPSHPDGGLAGVFVFEHQVLVTQDGCEVLSANVPARLHETETVANLA